MYKAILSLIVILGLSGCASYRTVAVQPKPIPLTKEFPDVQPDLTRSKKYLDKADFSLSDALSLALIRNPQLAVFSYETRIREAEALQASLLPNPEFDAEVENFAGSGTLNNFQGSELTFSVGQLIELGGKRQKRAQVAALSADLAAWDYEAVKLDVFVDVVSLFTNALAVQQQMDLRQELVNVAESFLKNIQRRVEAGRDSPAEAARAKVELSAAKIDLQRLQKELQSARKKLAATWGSDEPTFGRLRGNLDVVTELPALEKLDALVSNNPDIARWTTEIQQRDAELSLEKTQRIPDPLIGAGYRRLNQSGDNAFIMGISLPLQIFNRNQGNIQAAQYRKSQAEQMKRAVQISLSSALTEIYNNLSASYHEISTLKTSVIPEAQNAYEMIKQGYQMGKYGFLDVLAAQRSLFEVRSQYLNALADYHQNTARLERLIGQKLSDVQ